MNDETLEKQSRIQLIMQGLQELGFEKSFNQLAKESGLPYEPPEVQQLRHLIMTDQLEEAIGFIQSFGLICSEQIQTLIYERQYMLLLQQNETSKAVELLRSKANLYGQNSERLHALAALTVTEGPLPIQSPFELLQKIIELAYEELVILQPKRLQTLIIQQQSLGILQCSWHKGIQSGYSLHKIHSCPKESFDHLLLRIQLHQDEVTICQFSPNSRYLASICKQNRLCVSEFEFQKFDEKQQYQNGKNLKVNQIFYEVIHSNVIQAIQFSPCSQFLATCSQDNTIKMFSLFDEVKQIYHMKGHQDRVCGIGWHFIGDIESQKQKKNSIFSKTFSKIDPKKDVWELISGSIDGWLYFWRNGERKCGQKLESITRLHSNQKEGLIVEQARHKKLSFLNSKPHILRVIEEPDEIVSSNVSFDFQYLMVNVSYKDPRINLYSVNTFQLLKQFRGFLQNKSCLKGSIGWYNNNLIAIGSEDGYVHLWHRFNDKQLLEKIKVSNKQVNCVAFNQGNVDLIAVGSENLSVYTSSKQKIVVIQEQNKQRYEESLMQKVTSMLSNFVRQQAITQEQQQSSGIQQIHIDEEEENQQLQSEGLQEEESEVMEPEVDDLESN